MIRNPSPNGTKPAPGSGPLPQLNPEIAKWFQDREGRRKVVLTTTTAATGAQNYLPRPGSAIDGYETTFNNQQHVNYIGTDGHVHELYYTDHWSHNDLTAAAGVQNYLPAGAQN